MFRSEFKFLKFKVVDWKKIDPDEFLRSDKPEEVVLGVLAGKYKEKPEVLSKVVKKISEIVKNEKEVLKYMNDINFLASLFDIKIKVKPMPIQVDIRKAPFYKWGKEEGLKEGEKRGIEKGAISGIIQAKFGSQRSKQIKSFLGKIENINLLKNIKTEVIRAKTLEDFIKFLQNLKNSKKNRN